MSSDNGRLPDERLGEKTCFDMRGCIDDAVAQIAQHEASDCGEIEAVLERINHLVAMQSNAFLRNMKRVQVAREGQEKLHQAQLRVASELAALTQGRAVPAVFKHLLESGWRKLLVLTLLKQGDKSEAWKTYTAALGQLLELLQVRSKDAKLVVTKDYLSKVKAVAQVLKRGIDEGGAGTFNDYRGADELGRLLLHKGDDDKFQSLLKPELLQAEVPETESFEPELLQSQHSEPELPASSKLPTIGSCENVAARRSIWSRKVQRMEIGDGLPEGSTIQPDRTRLSVALRSPAGVFITRC